MGNQIFSGKKKVLSSEDVLTLERELGIRLVEPGRTPSLSPLAREAVQLIEANPEVRTFWEAFLSAQRQPKMPWLETSELEKVGAKAIELARQSPDKPAKVGADLVSWLGNYIEKRERAKA